MKIVEMRVTPIAIADPPLRSSYGLHAPYALRLVVELVSEDGFIGIAEAHGGARALHDFQRSIPKVIGSSAYDLSALAALLDELTVGEDQSGRDRSQLWAVPGNSSFDVANRVYAAVEVAALDLIGQATRRPIHQLLGGKVRDEVPFSAYLFFKHHGGGGTTDDARVDRYGEAMTPDAVVAQASQLIAEYGFKSLKLKAGVHDPAVEIATILALRDRVGSDAPLRMDPNAAWSLSTSISVARALRGVLEYLEDPTPELRGMGDLRRQLRREGIDTPLASNVAVTSFADLPEAIAEEAVQVVLSDHHYWGGLRALTHLGVMCKTFGLGLSMHSNSHLGVSLLAMTHVAAAIPHLTFACDTHYPWQDARDEIVTGGRVPIIDGAVRVPDAPGLGAKLDYDALARGAERYESCGYRIRDDEAEMRRVVQSDWRRRVPTW